MPDNSHQLLTILMSGFAAVVEPGAADGERSVYNSKEGEGTGGRVAAGVGA